MRPRLYTLGTLLGATLFATSVSAQSAPDPSALLRGVEQARKPLHGKLRLEFIRETLAPKPERFGTAASVEFDRDRWRFILYERRLVSPADQVATRNRVIEANGGDPRAAEKAGLGQMTDVKVTSVFDGNQLIQYSDMLGGYIRVHQNGSVYLCFDPRLLGLSRSHTPNYSLPECLRLDGRGTPSVVGPEEMAGKPVWHVKVELADVKVDYHYWIADTEGFRVYRYEYRQPSDGSSIQVVSTFEYGKDSKAPLPDRVTVEETNRGGKRKIREVYSIVEPDYDYRPDPAIFGYKGLDMAPGAMVIDDRVNRVVGYFNGTDLSEDPHEALSRAAVIAATEVQPRSPRWPIYTGIATVVLLLGVAGIRRSARRRVA